jgi:hypothetical protein
VEIITNISDKPTAPIFTVYDGPIAVKVETLKMQKVTLSMHL